MRINGDYIEPSSGTKIEVPDGFGFGVGGTERLRISSSGIYAPGSVIQVQSTTKSDAFSTTSATLVDITGLSVSITPKFTTSKILVIACVASGRSGDTITNFQLKRDSTSIAISTGGTEQTTMASYFGSSFGSTQITTLSINHLDNPATTSSLTYKLQMKTDGAGTHYVNSNGVGNRTAISSITVMEIGG